MPQRQRESQREVTADLVARIQHELDGRLDRIESDPPAWYDELAQHHRHPADRRAAAADVLVWRAVSGQEDADTALDKAPTEKDNTARYHQAAHAALRPAPEDRAQGRDARHDALVSGLSDNWINLEPDPSHQPVQVQAAEDFSDRDREVREGGPSQ